MNGSRLSAALAALVVGATACGAPPVRASPPSTPSGPEAEACRRLVAALPSGIGKGLRRRQVEPPNELVAAWGRPAVVLYCGTGLPSAYRPGGQLVDVNDIGWFPEQRPADVVYTTTERSPRVSLVVPLKQASSFEILADLAGPVAQYSRGPDLIPK